jgi:NTE family protein
MTGPTEETGGSAAPQEPGSPVRRLPTDPPEDVLDPGTALCLSGGGYRAMVFHVGVLWRLNEAGLLPGLKRVSSVSGGSVTAGVLALNWSRLGFDGDGVGTGFVPAVVEPVRAMAREHIDVSAVLGGLLSPFSTISDRVVKAYRKHLFGKATLQDLPDEPRFVFNATNLESGVLMRLSKPYLADYRVGRVLHPDLSLAVAVAASSAFPPFLSPCTVDLTHEDWVTDPGNDLAQAAYREEIALSDGGVYDNLGIETAWKQYRSVFVSDAGGQLGADATPPSDWGRHLVRVLGVIDNQVRSLRKRQVVGAFRTGQRTGMYVGIRSELGDFPLADPIPTDPGVTRKLAFIATRLDALDEDQQELLVNWGYAVCDAGLRSHVRKDLPRGSLPYPGRPLTGQG